MFKLKRIDEIERVYICPTCKSLLGKFWKYDYCLKCENAYNRHDLENVRSWKYV